jgi:2-iminobutanoate/2-iminopropanoate deaminase
MQIRRINANAAPVPTTGYSQALEVTGHTRMLFISGQTPVEADGTVPADFETQCRLAWRNVEAQLAAAGMTLDNLVMHRTYLADRRYTHLNRSTRIEFLGGWETALTVVIAGTFDDAWLLEIEAVAVAGRKTLQQGWRSQHVEIHAMPCPAGSFHRWPRCSHHVGNRPRSTTLSSSCRGIVRPALVWRGLAPFCDLGRAERLQSADRQHFNR